MTTPTRPLPPGVEIQRLENGWFPSRRQSDGNYVYMNNWGQWGPFASSVLGAGGWTTDVAAKAAFWAHHDAQPKNQAKGEPKYDSPGYRAGYAAGLESAERVISDLTARVAALEGKAKARRLLGEMQKPSEDLKVQPSPDRRQACTWTGCYCDKNRGEAFLKHGSGYFNGWTTDDKGRTWAIVEHGKSSSLYRGQCGFMDPGRVTFLRTPMDKPDPSSIDSTHPPEPVVGMAYMEAKMPNDCRRWRWLGDGLAEMYFGSGLWGPPSEALGTDIERAIRSGHLVPVPGYRVEGKQ